MARMDSCYGRAAAWVGSLRRSRRIRRRRPPGGREVGDVPGPAGFGDGVTARSLPRAAVALIPVSHGNKAGS